MIMTIIYWYKLQFKMGHLGSIRALRNSCQQFWTFYVYKDGTEIINISNFT